MRPAVHERGNDVRNGYVVSSAALAEEMAAPRSSSKHASGSDRPECPTCHDSSFVKQEQVITGSKAIAFWTCSSCMRSWPAAAPRMAKADLAAPKNRRAR